MTLSPLWHSAVVPTWNRELETAGFTWTEHAERRDALDILKNILGPQQLVEVVGYVDDVKLSKLKLTKIMKKKKKNTD